MDTISPIITMGILQKKISDQKITAILRLKKELFKFSYLSVFQKTTILETNLAPQK